MSDAVSTIDQFEREIRKFIHHEARLIDERRFDEWLALFADDARYWIPSKPGQTDAKAVPSIIYEDRALLTIRVSRLTHPRAYAALPTPRTMHVVGNLEIRDHDVATDQFRVSSNLLVVEHQEATMQTFAGHCEHILRRSDDGFIIALKRIDLIDCDAVHGIITALL